MQPSVKSGEMGMSLHATRLLSQDHSRWVNTTSGVAYITHAVSDEEET